MPDQILALHRVSPRCFELSGVRTASIRDQLLRSTLMVRALVHVRLIGKNKPLLVFGAGVAGMNAAMLAARDHSTDVFVIEREKKPFLTVNQAYWRYISPTEYDWPHEHWDEGEFPHPADKVALRQQAGFAPQLASAWARVWQEYEEGPPGGPAPNGAGGKGLITLLTESEAGHYLYTDAGAQAMLRVWGRWRRGSPAVSSRRFGALLSCVGIGKEKVSEPCCSHRWGGYTGPGFWSDDDGLVSDAPYRKVTDVLISGGGDGAMQDFQRVLTTDSGSGLLRKLRLIEVAKGWNDLLPRGDMLRQFLCAEDAGRRAVCWAPGDTAAAHAMEHWHQAFVQPVEALVGGWSQRKTRWVIESLFRTSARNHQLRKLTWVMLDATPGYCYALNRFLVLLLARAASQLPEYRGLITVLNQHKIHKITPRVPHLCTSAVSCIGYRHQVAVRNVRPGAHRRSPPPIDADMIIVRHGIESANLLGGAPVPEQMVPFSLPH